MAWKFPKVRKLAEGDRAVCIICRHVLELETREQSAMCEHSYASMSIQCVDGQHMECLADTEPAFSEGCCVCICHGSWRSEEQIVASLSRIEQELSHDD